MSFKTFCFEIKIVKSSDFPKRFIKIRQFLKLPQNWAQDCIDSIDNKNFTRFNNIFFVPELASSLFNNAVKMLCAQAQARALPEQQ